VAWANGRAHDDGNEMQARLQIRNSDAKVRNGNAKVRNGNAKVRNGNSNGEGNKAHHEQGVAAKKPSSENATGAETKHALGNKTIGCVS
jgi:hypothetical protein